MDSSLKGLWLIVLSGYPGSGKTMLAKRLVADYPRFARIGVDELREMLFNEAYPCRDEFLVYSMITEMRDSLLGRGYSVVIDSTAPNNLTRDFLLTSRFSRINSLLVVFTVDRETLIERSLKRFGTSTPIDAYDKHWEDPRGGMAVFKFKSNTLEEFEACYARLRELLESEIHPFKPEFQQRRLALNEIRQAFRSFLSRRTKQTKPHAVS
ncbi:MAG: ATP-binding protein [Candidatus Bathyarchaeia archaeon]